MDVQFDITRPVNPTTLTEVVKARILAKFEAVSFWPERLWLHVNADLTAQERTDIEAILAAHDAAVLTPDQQQEQDDQTTVEALLGQINTQIEWLNTHPVTDAASAVAMGERLRLITIQELRAFRWLIRKMK